MAGPFQLAFDVSSVSISTAVPGVAWALLFGLAWKYPRFAESLGLGRREFWLLLPGALLASFALAPLLPIANDILAVSFAGAAFPLAVGLLALGRVAPPLGRSVGRFLLPLGVEVGALLAIAIAADRGALGAAAHAVGTSAWAFELAVLTLVAAGAVVTVLAVYGTRTPADRALGAAFGLTNAVLLLTFAGSNAIPGVGITESFPYYLLPPALAGVVAAVLAPRLFRGSEGFALPLAFLASGWGVVLGADVLWEPPLYGSGPGGLYVIGGAGVLDLVYLSCFLGLFGAFWAHVGLRRGATPAGPELPPEPSSPSALIREAYARGVEGQVARSLALSAAAARSAGFQARRLLGASPAAGPRPWDGVPVPGWVVSDAANLESAARAGTTDPKEAVRGWATARALVLLGEALTRPRFASVRERLLAFVVDLLVLGLAASAVFVGVIAVSGGSLNAVLSGVGYNAAVYGFIAASLLYFALGELWTGVTLGKWLLGIEVRDRALRPVGGIAAFVRNTPLLPALTLYSLGLAIAVAIVFRGGGAGGDLAGLGTLTGTVELLGLLGVVLVGVGLAGVLGLLVIRLTAERQRVGDLWARTWVVRRLTAPTVPPGVAPAPIPSG